MKQEVLAGQIDYTVLILIRDDAGAPATGLTEASVDIAYARVETDNDVTTADVTPAALASLTAAHTDWGIEEVSATDHPGLYRLDIADAVFATGAWSAVVSVTGTGLDPCQIEFIMVPHTPLTGVLLAPTTHTSAVIPTVTTTGTATAVTTVNGLAANVITAAATAADFGTEIGTAVWATTTRELTHLDEDNTTIDINGVTVGAVAGAVGSVTGNVGGNVTGSVGSVATGGIAAASFAAGAIDASAIAANAIGASEIADGAIDAGAIAADAITAAKIADGAIDAATFAAGAINAAATAADFLAEVNAEVVDALNTDTYAEPGQGAPAATASLVAKIGYLYKAWRNKHTQTATEYALYGDDGVTKDQEAGVGDDGVTFTRNEMQTGA